MFKENIIFKSLLVCSFTLLLGCGNKSFSLDGFKSVKFDMSSSQLEGVGYKCTPDKKSCRKDSPRVDLKSENETLFGQSTRLSVDLTEDKVSCIFVGVDIEDKELIELFEKALGKPTTFQFNQIFTGNILQKNFWVSSEETSITVTAVLNKQPPEGLFKMLGPHSAAAYCNKQETSKLIVQAKNAAIKPKDF